MFSINLSIFYKVKSFIHKGFSTEINTKTKVSTPEEKANMKSVSVKKDY